VTQDTEPRVHALIERMTSALAGRDIDGVMATYERDAIVAFEPGMPTSGDATLREGFAGLLAADPRFVFRGHEIIVSGDLALHLMPWTMNGTAPDGSTIEQEGLSVAVLRRQADGRWLMVIDNPHGQRLLP
jgi:uncharacterized protein (TIGR02246 family)